MNTNKLLITIDSNENQRKFYDVNYFDYTSIDSGLISHDGAM
jgi:hypothetical protein